MDKPFFIIGKFGKVHGVKGLIKLYSTTDFPEIYLQPGSFYIRKNKIISEINCVSIKQYRKEVFLVGIEDVDIDEAVKFSNVELLLPTEERVQTRGNTIYIEDVIGMSVHDEDDKFRGTVIDAEQGPGNDILHIKGNDNEVFLFPFTRQWVISFNRDKEIIKIKLNEGME